MMMMMMIFSLFQPPTSSFSAMTQKHRNWDQDLHGIGTQQNHRSKCSSGQQSFRQERLKTKLRSQQSLGFFAFGRRWHHGFFSKIWENESRIRVKSAGCTTFADWFSISRSLQCQEFMVDGRMDCVFWTLPFQPPCSEALSTRQDPAVLPLNVGSYNLQPLDFSMGSS